MGSVPGEPETAVSLLKSKFWVIVIPGMLPSLKCCESLMRCFLSGGADEGMVGHENAYQVYWPKKRQFDIDASFMHRIFIDHF